ncbi:uncharacterized protein M421DRAFT_6477 [Didymella exigua CBS 183.55]|uniref:Uncharacterized protein n=1 Tax=Didymella exigua CBS 183.55 TaxID=1150837 RepID=A0A6A5RF59_9PLEO|nr:uncharacterized protein M421DRAFT_6477 [Didymella exigua CBS 183.55]KAF1926905.1 hypothetical protein M421DRAFT_6477 [Didymella exigua CBS 183.55]
MTSTRQPKAFSPVDELPSRRLAPVCLYIVVENVASATIDQKNCSIVTPAPGDLRAKLDFKCEDLTRSDLHTHLIHSNCSNLSTKFISVFENEGRIPVWLEHGDLPMIPKGVLYMRAEAINAFDASIWIRLDEVRESFGLKPNEGDKGEWLACGFIPRSMVAAQVALQDYQRRPDLAHALPSESGASRSGSINSIRSISRDEQEEHIKAQILRNKASREDLRRTKAASKKASHGREDQLLRQAIKNSQRASREDNESEVIGRRSNATSTHVKPQQATSDVSIESSTEEFADSSRYASVRSFKLREALKRREASNPIEYLRKKNLTPVQGLGELTENRTHSLPTRDSLGGRYPRAAGDGAASQQETSALIQFRELLLCKGSDNDSTSQYFETLSSVRDPDEVSDPLPRSERLRRARTGKREVGFYALGQNPRLESGAKTHAGPDTEDTPQNILDYALGVVSSVLDEITQHRVKSALHEPAVPPADEEMPGYEADISDNHSSASERTFSRRTRRRSQHSRLTTPLSIYDHGQRTQTRN